MMSYWNPGWKAMCPSCEAEIESSAHITRCKDPGRRKMLQSSVQELVDWMYESTDDEEMASAISDYLMHQGEITLGEVADNNIRAGPVRATNRRDGQTRMGFSEGRVSSQWVKYASDRLGENGNPMSPEGWTRKLMDKLLKTTHQQWIYRNHKVHFRGKGGLTLQQHDESYDRLGELMYTDPDELLPQHQHLLLVDKDKVCRGTLSEQRTWIVKMKAAKRAMERLSEDTNGKGVEEGQGYQGKQAGEHE